MSKPSLVIFDCDGVLVDSERISVEIEAKVLTSLGWPHTTDDVVERWMGRPHQSQIQEIAAHLGQEGAALFAERTVSEVTREFEARLAPVEGVEAVLEHLDRRRYSKCVASSGTPSRIELVLGLTGLLDRFQGHIYSTTEVENGKPAPDLFLHAASREGVGAESCIVIEDSVNGVKAAVAAGMTVYGFAGGMTSPGRLAEVGAIPFHRMSDLISLLAP